MSQQLIGHKQILHHRRNIGTEKQQQQRKQQQGCERHRQLERGESERGSLTAGLGLQPFAASGAWSRQRLVGGGCCGG